MVGDDLGDVAPANLVAALKKDDPQRKVIMVRTLQDKDACRHARAAGADALLDDAQFLSLLPLAASPLRLDEIPGRTHLTIPSPASSTQPVKQVQVPQPAVARSAQGIAVSLVSACGGTGKTALAILLALAGLRNGVQSALVDLDLQFGEIPFLLGGEVPAGQESSIPLDLHGLPQGFQVEYRQPEGCGGSLPLLSSPAGPEQAETLSQAIPSCVAALKGQVDLTIMDTGAFWTEIQASVMDVSDVIIMLMDQRSSSLRACQRARDLCSSLGIPSSRFLPVLNRCSGRSPLSGMDVAFALGVDRVVELRDGGDEVEELLSLGKPGELFAANNAFARSATELLESLLATRGKQVRPRRQAGPRRENRRRKHVSS